MKHSVLILIFVLVLLPTVLFAEQTKSRYQVTDVEMEWQQPEQQVHTLQMGSSAQSSEAAAQVEDKADRLEDGSIFQGPWLDGKPHGNGTCYKDGEKATCGYFSGILVMYEGDDKRNTMMQRCLGLSHQEMNAQYPDLETTELSYKQKLHGFLYRCYEASDEML